MAGQDRSSLLVDQANAERIRGEIQQNLSGSVGHERTVGRRVLRDNQVSSTRSFLSRQ